MQNKIYKIILALLFITINANSQEIKINSNLSLNIPKQFKSKTNFETSNMEKYSIETKYFKKIKGYITTTFDEKGNVLVVNSSVNVSKDLLTGEEKTNKKNKN